MLRCMLPNPCSQIWSELRRVQGTEHVRFCEACRRQVYWCDTQGEIAARLNRRQCVAFREPGMPDADGAPTTWVGNRESSYGERH